MTNDSSEETTEIDRMLKQAKISDAVAGALYGQGTPAYDREVARLLGKNTLHAELEKDPKPLATSEPYELSKQVIDSLVAHTRQDVAMSFGMLDALLRRVDEQSRSIRTLTRIVWTQLALLVVVTAMAYR